MICVKGSKTDLVVVDREDSLRNRHLSKSKKFHRRGEGSFRCYLEVLEDTGFGSDIETRVVVVVEDIHLIDRSIEEFLSE